MRTFRTRLLALLTGVVLVGCRTDHVQPNLTDPDPSRKIPAIKEAADSGDKSKTVHLVDDLDSDDPAVRMYAIHALKDLTGRTFGYRYYDEEDQRAAAVARWRAWLNDADHK